MRIETFHAAVPEFAEDRIREQFGTVSMSATRISFEQWSASEDRFALLRMRLDGRFSFAGEVPMVVISSGTGSYRWDVGRHSGDATQTPMACGPGVRAASCITDADVHVVNLEVASLETSLRALCADDARELSLRTQARDADAALRWRTAALVAMTEANLGHLESDLIRARTYTALAATALEVFAPGGERRERSLTRGELSAIHRRARQFIDDSAALPITAEDVAVAARACARDVDRAFRARDPRHRSMDDYLLRVRLQGAHDDLSRADPSRGDTIAEVALRWGFGWPRHFADRHAAVFGTTPGQVLER
ncbi:helix-turn-helix domain-containing protein [Microbacterium sp. RD1]|uniref:AraC family transcriptional regulator n=1 Tax=Microbacterium sp. RD1 TaxID=3457313 RepID=UPI003FA54058